MSENKVPFENNSVSVMDIDVDTTDAFTKNELSSDVWEKKYVPFLLEGTGILKFRMYGSCSCSVEMSLDLQADGYNIDTNERRCDMCRKDPPHVNNVRISSIFKAVGRHFRNWVKSKDNFERFAKIVRDKTGRDLQAEGVNGVSVNNGDNHKHHKVMEEMGRVIIFADEMGGIIQRLQSHLDEDEREKFEIISEILPKIRDSKFFEDCVEMCLKAMKERFGNMKDMSQKATRGIARKLGVDEDELRGIIENVMEEIVDKDKDDNDKESE